MNLSQDPAIDPGSVKQATEAWIERWVLGQGLCPFASRPWSLGVVRICVYDGESLDGLVAALHRELLALHAAKPATLETTLLVAPALLGDFLDFNDFLEVAQAVLVAEGLEESYQFASFHPDYQFEQTRVDDRANYTNRSPYPTLQLLRQSSINEVLTDLEDPSQIYERNIQHLRGLDERSWRALLDRATKTP